MSKEINYKKYFENKNITKQGFGVLGRGLGVVKFLLKNGANLLITDNKEESFFIEQIDELKKWMQDNYIEEQRVKFVFGKHEEEDFLNCDYIVQASGVAKDNIYLKKARENNIPVYQESSLFLKIIMDFNENLQEENKIKIITITGTRGKTATTYLIYKILKDHFEEKLKDRKTYLGGNVQGISTIELLEKIKEKDIVVMETDSRLAQGFEYIEFAPDIAVFTNLMRDHMNYYKDDMSDYFSDKAKTFLYQKQNNILIADEDLKDYLNNYLKVEFKDKYNNLKSKKIFINKEDIEKDKDIFKSEIKGEHNRLNISLAIRVAKELNIDIDDIKESIKSFKGVAGRLEFVKEINNVKYYNDTAATTGEAVIAAINPFEKENNQIILITGGRDKDLKIENYVNKLILEKENKKIKEIIFLNDDTTTGTAKVLDKMKEKDFEDFILCKNLKDAVLTAKENAEKNDIVLFSPGFASFGMFLNEYDRGEKFLKFI